MKIMRFILAASFLLAMAITISCSSDDGDDISLFKESLREDIVSLENEISEVEESEDGSDKLTTVYWITPDRMESINKAIQDAKEVYDNKDATIGEISSAQTKLAIARAMLNGKKLGSKKE